MHKYIFKNLLKISNKKKIDFNKSKVLFIGLTFKENCNDFRNSKSIDLLNLIDKKFKKVEIYDPYIKLKNLHNFKKFKYSKLEKIKKNKFDILILSVPHKKVLKFLSINAKKILNKNYIIFDIKNKLKLKENSVDFTL